jgi:hypothetical protein
MYFRKKLYLNLVILLTIFIAQPMLIHGQITGKKVLISPAPDYNLSTVTAGRLVWPEGKPQFMTINLTIELLPDNLSKIEVPLIIFAYMSSTGGSDQIIDQEPVRPNIILSNSNKTVLVNATLLPPVAADRFYFNITLYVRSVGNVTQAEGNPFAVRFPDADSGTNTILVDRDRVVPLINIYGFPPDSFFQKWLPIYGAALFLMVSPAIAVGITKLSRSAASETEVKIEEEEEQQ